MLTYFHMIALSAVNLGDLKIAISTNNLRITLHANEELENDNIVVSDIKLGFNNAEIIEVYPLSKPYPSCLVLCFDNVGNPIHTVWAYVSEIKFAILITGYRPDPRKWVEYRKRK